MQQFDGFDVQGFFIALRRREPWRRRAKCAGVGVGPFFPDRGASRKEAKALCASCPVAKECAAHAEKFNEEYGIWGGETMHRGRSNADELDSEESVGTGEPERIVGERVRELPKPVEQDVQREAAAAFG